MATADVVDNDTEQAALALWKSDGQNLPTLFQQPPTTGRVKQNLPATIGGAPPAKVSPYATIASVKLKDPVRHTGGAHSDFRKLTLTIYGIRADVVKGLGFALMLFNQYCKLSYPSTDSSTKLPRFIWFHPTEPSGRIEEDPETAQGQDWWRGIIEGEVHSTRLDPGAPAVASSPN